MRNRQLEIAVALTLAFILMACGANARQRTITVTFAATNAAAEKLVEFSDAHERAIVNISATREQAESELAAFRKKVDHAEKTFAAVYRMLAAAAIVDDDRSLSALVQVAALLWTELKELGVKL